MNKEVLLNGRNLTNVGLFRRYMEKYALEHPGIHQGMSRDRLPYSKGQELGRCVLGRAGISLNRRVFMSAMFILMQSAAPRGGP